jgi:hypothetical protein
MTQKVYDFILKSSLAYFKNAGYFGTQTEVGFEGTPAVPGQLTRILLETRGIIVDRRSL